MKDKFSHGYFFFSKKMLETMEQHARNNNENYHPNFCIIDGKKKQYTDWCQSPKSSAQWDDLVYLGEGEYCGL